jgi:hypothetical protein
METSVLEHTDKVRVVRGLEETYKQLRSVEVGADTIHKLFREIADCPTSGETYTVDGSVMLALVGLIDTVETSAAKATAAVDAAGTDAT